MNKQLKYIGLLLLCVLVGAQGLYAKTPKAKADKQAQHVEITPEQEQQFTYYWYAAKQAIMDSRYDEAYVLLSFCHAIKPDDAITLRFMSIIESSIQKNIEGMVHMMDAFEIAPADEWYAFYRTLRSYAPDSNAGSYVKILEEAYEAQKAQDRVEEELLEELQEAYLSVGDWKKALAMQDALDAQTGYNEQSAMFRALVYQGVGKPKLALKEIDRYLAIDPTMVQLLFLKVEIIQTTGKPKEVLALYEQLMQIAPDNMMIINNYAYYMANHGGDLKKAEQLSAKTIQAAPNSSTFLDTYGWILHLQGQDELALFYLERALQQMGEDETEVQNEIIEHIHIVKKKHEK